MIITPHPYGRLANRLILASHWIAHVEETSDQYLHLCFADYARFFEGTKGGLFLRYPSSHYKPRSPLQTFDCINIWNTNDKRNEHYDLSAPEFREHQDRARYLLTIGWCFRTSPEIMQRHRDILVDFFRPVEKHRAVIDRCIEQARRGADHLIGVHIRQTDYRKFNNGKWFFSLPVYRRAMESMQAQRSGHCRFLLSSDASVDEGALSGLDTVRAPGHPVEDCYSLAQCDYILGPPSTFSHWASFYGRVPLIHIADPDQPIQLALATYRKS